MESVKVAFLTFISIATELYRKLAKYKQEHIFLWQSQSTVGLQTRTRENQDWSSYPCLESENFTHRSKLEHWYELVATDY